MSSKHTGTVNHEKDTDGVKEIIFNVDLRGPQIGYGLLKDRKYLSLVEGKRSLESLIEGFGSLHNKIHIIWNKNNLQSFIMSTDPHLPTPHNEGTKKRSKTIEGHINSHTQRGYGNYNHHGSFEIPIQRTDKFSNGGRHTNPRDGRRGGLGGRGYNRPQDEVPRHEA
ncbi:hypothetical protein M9H77_11716 [Catharanthus roseus]|uniref:Uncharacterized protein n=1 Tax=Catharanthus roseus TaxID=4058 RepID=A0ACC0BFI3_CATRO|nr:hypothetical protein M9H77_11716 [Catharanthus roseus]